MAETEEKKKLLKESSEKDLKDDKIKKCTVNGKEYSGIFKLNGWKTTLIIVFVSLTFGFQLK